MCVLILRLEKSFIALFERVNYVGWVDEEHWVSDFAARAINDVDACVATEIHQCNLVIGLPDCFGRLWAFAVTDAHPLVDQQIEVLLDLLDPGDALVLVNVSVETCGLGLWKTYQGMD